MIASLQSAILKLHQSVLELCAFNFGFHGAHHNRPDTALEPITSVPYRYIRPQLHPNLEQKYLLPYLWRTCIWPAKRLDYLGNPVVLDESVKYVDWIPSADIKANKYQLGAEN